MTPLTGLGIALGGLAVAAGGTVAVLVVTTSGPFADDDDGDQVENPTAAVATGTAANSVMPSPTGAATATEPATPGGALKSYTQPASSQSDSFSFQYAADWFVRGGKTEPGQEGLAVSAFSYDPSGSTDTPDIPKGEVKVGVYVVPETVALDCAGSGASAGMLGALPALEETRSGPFADSHEQFLSRIVAIEAKKGPFSYCVVGYFTADRPDEAEFRTLVDSFEVH